MKVTGGNEQSQKELPHILVVDDDSIVLSVVELALQNFECTFTLTSDPHEAVRLLREQEFDILITDYLMDGMTGAELIAWVKEISPSTTPILMTGYADLDSIPTGTQWLKKPFRITYLHCLIEEAAVH